MSITMTLEEQPNPADVAFINEQLRLFNAARSEEDDHRPFAILMRDDAGHLAGGLLGGTYWGWLHVEILWVREDLRGQGFGKRLLVEAEAEAVRRGCRHVHLDTLDFQAPEFYRRLGYFVWGVLDDLPPGHQRIFLKKDL